MTQRKRSAESPQFSHLDIQGRTKMVDVGAKPEQKRIAKAQGKIFMAQETLALIRENLIKKGDVLTVAEIAGIQAAKRTAEWIPLCHSLPLTHVEVNTSIDDDGILVLSQVATYARTGVEMEALTAVTAALLTLYDMCKAVDKQMKMGDIFLLEKHKV